MSPPLGSGVFGSVVGFASVPVPELLNALGFPAPSEEGLEFLFERLLTSVSGSVQPPVLGRMSAF